MILNIPARASLLVNKDEYYSIVINNPSYRLYYLLLKQSKPEIRMVIPHDVVMNWLFAVYGNINHMKSYNFSRRFFELQEKFNLLQPKIEDINLRQAFSIINGMFHETWRNISDLDGNGNRSEITAGDIVNIHTKAPRMEGPAVCIPLKTGQKAPDFELKDITDKTVRLSDFRGSTVLLVFYPLDWSPGCSQQLDLYQSEIEEFNKRNVKLIGISVDSIYSHFAWAAVRKIQFPLLSDFNPKGETAKKYNVFRDKEGFSDRALFVIDKEGIIQYSYVSPFLHHIPDIYDLFKTLDEIKPVTTL